MSSESSYDQFNDFNHNIHHSCSSVKEFSNGNQKQQLQTLFTKSSSTGNVESSFFKLQNRPDPCQSYPTLLDHTVPSRTLIMKPAKATTLSSLNQTSSANHQSMTCLPTITRTGKGKMSLNSNVPKLMTFPPLSTEVPKVGRIEQRSQQKHLSSLSSSPSPSSYYSYSSSSNQSLPSSFSCSIFFPSRRFTLRRGNRCSSSRSMFTSCNFFLMILFYYLVQTSNCECEKSFDAVFCDLPDSYSNGATGGNSGTRSTGNRFSSHSNSEQEQPSALPFLSTSVTSGYGFKSGKIWSLECVSSDEVNVLKNSMKPFELPERDRHAPNHALSAAFSDGETYYLIQVRKFFFL